MRLGTRSLACALLFTSAMSGCAALVRPDARDVRITAEVNARLAQHAELQAPNTLDVQTLRQVVYLHGLMATPFEISLAGSVAAEVPGVRRVENAIGLENAR